MIEIQRITFRNFMSFGDYDTKVDLNTARLTLITAPNGNGKSVLAEAISFGLFNKSYRGINKNELINNQSTRACEVKVSFKADGVSYSIERGLKPTKFDIYKEGVLMNKDSSRDYQKFLEENILKFDYRAFCQTVILGTAGFMPFMKMSSGLRREFVDSMLDVNIFALMTAEMKKDLSQWESSLVAIERDLDVLDIQEKSKKELYYTLSKNTDERVDEYLEELRVYKSKFVVFKKNIDRIQAERNSIIIEDATDLLAERKHNQSEILDLGSRKRVLQMKIKHIKEGNCSACGQIITGEYASKENKELSNSVVEIEAEVDKLEAICSDIESKLSTIKKNIERKTTLVKEEDELTNKIQQLRSEAEATTERVERIRNSTVFGTEIPTLKKIIDDLAEHITKKKLEQQKLMGQEDVYKSAKKILKDGGIKTAVIRQYLPLLNRCFSKYLLYLGFKYTISLDENFEETIFTTSKTDLKYFSLSMGERQRVDLAMMFAWRDVARSKNSLVCNLLFLDEVLDSGLDANGVEDIMNVLTSLQNTNIFVISHRPEFLSDHMERVITVDKASGYSVYK